MVAEANLELEMIAELVLEVYLLDAEFALRLYDEDHVQPLDRLHQVCQIDCWEYQLNVQLVNVIDPVGILISKDKPAKVSTQNHEDNSKNGGYGGEEEQKLQASDDTSGQNTIGVPGVRILDQLDYMMGFLAKEKLQQQTKK